MSSLKEQRAQEKLKKQQRKAETKGVLTPAEELNELGVEYAEKEIYDKALDYFNQAIQLNSNLADAYVNRGEIYSRKKQYEQALNNFNQAIKLNPKFALAYNNRGLVYKKLENYEEALNDLNEAILLGFRDSDVYNSRGTILSNYGEIQGLNDFNRAIQLNPKNANAYYNRGKFYNENKKEYEQALQDYNYTIELYSNGEINYINNELAEIYGNRGIVYSNLGNYEQALNDYNHAISLDPNNILAYNNKGLIYFEQKCYEQAIENYNQVLQINPYDSDAYNNRGLVYFEQKKHNQALNDFKQALNYAKDNNLIYKLNLIIQTIYSQQGLFKKAKEYVEKAFEHANFEERLHKRVYLKSIELSERMQSLVRNYTHTLGNTLFPENVLAVIENLKRKSPELCKEILQLYGVYQAETTIRQQGELLRIRYMTNNPDEFVFLIKNSCLLANSKESGTSIENVFNQALESIVSRFLNLNYGKLELARNCLNLDWKELKENFEQQIYFEHQNIVDWTNQHLMNIDLIFETDKWQQVRFKPQEHAEALFFEYFNELLLNTFKYADFKQGLQIHFYMQPIENVNYLYCKWQNTCRQNIISGSQIGLEKLKEDLSQLNQSTIPETTVQIINENNLFKITLAFKKDLILFELSPEDRERIERNTNRWLTEKRKKQHAHLMD